MKKYVLLAIAVLALVNGSLYAADRDWKEFDLLGVVPGSGYHRSEVQAVVAALNKAGDARVHLIDIPLMKKLVPNVGLLNQGSYDGGHPTMYGQAVFGAGVALEAQKILNTKGGA
jgi:hypothetical protein